METKIEEEDFFSFLMNTGAAWSSSWEIPLCHVNISSSVLWESHVPPHLPPMLIKFTAEGLLEFLGWWKGRNRVHVFLFLWHQWEKRTQSARTVADSRSFCWVVLTIIALLCPVHGFRKWTPMCKEVVVGLFFIWIFSGFLCFFWKSNMKTDLENIMNKIALITVLTNTRLF